jgi:hypothetical protein
MEDLGTRDVFGGLKTHAGDMEDELRNRKLRDAGIAGYAAYMSDR